MLIPNSDRMRGAPAVGWSAQGNRLAGAIPLVYGQGMVSDLIKDSPCASNSE
jgi:hypothetical protein